MKNKVIITISILLVGITILAIILTSSNSDERIPVDNIKEMSIGIYNEDGTVTDAYGNDVTDNPEGYNSMAFYKAGGEFRPVEKWYTKVSVSPDTEIEVANVLQSVIKGYVEYQTQILCEGDEYLYEPISSMYGTTDFLFNIYTEDEEYVACRIGSVIYYYNIEDSIVHSVNI